MEVGLITKGFSVYELYSTPRLMHLKEFQTIDTSVVGETMERVFGLQFDIQKGKCIQLTMLDYSARIRHVKPKTKVGSNSDSIFHIRWYVRDPKSNQSVAVSVKILQCKIQ